MEFVDLGVSQGRLYQGDGRLAIVLPGAHYLPGYPLLWFAREALQQHGWGVLEVWDELENRSEWQSWAAERARAGLEYSVGSRKRLLVAKSLSSFAAQVPETEDLPAVWLTPLLNEPDVVSALGRRRAASLLVGGAEDDPHWLLAAAARVPNAEVLEIDGADHSLQIEGDVFASLDVLRRVVERVGAFAAKLDD